ncbi:hypothetical protein [Comamonas odontotermitis]|uniref:hypothetical protein n=1 Tax=Comamonas odontotermitis TaxID=379895 RepID=UPI001CC36D63|nr:hypothetical protein [Comamonas odontotermitis]UBB16698.1 hypothetical protein LAD35_18190 [Comamonas odontotermitis]
MNYLLVVQVFVRIPTGSFLRGNQHPKHKQRAYGEPTPRQLSWQYFSMHSPSLFSMTIKPNVNELYKAAKLLCQDRGINPTNGHRQDFVSLN